MKNKKYLSIVALGTLAMTFALAVPAFAETNINEGANINVGAGLNSWNGKGMGQIKNRPGILFGTVTAVNGTTITLSTKAGPSGQPVATTYTVNTTTTTTVVKNNVASTVSNIAVGDMISVQGTVGTTVNVINATSIKDGIGGKNGNGDKNKKENNMPLIAGNGQPVVAGTVTAVSGSTITITNKSNVTYTVDATNAKIQKGNVLSTVSNIAVGDMIVVQGPINNSSIIASSVIDQGTVVNATNGNGKPAHKGFFGSIGSFFSHLFGF